MVVKLQFTKVSGAGNDFVLLENMNDEVALDKAKLATALCSRAFGVGADGLLLLEPSEKADFFMRYYNADGSYGGMCGNGGRCIARYAYLKRFTGPSMRFEALDFIYQAEVNGPIVKLQMKDPEDVRLHMSVEVDRRAYIGQYVNTGSPHFVLVMDQVDSVDVNIIGRQLRFHPAFGPEGANIDFVSSGAPMQLRTYERGVEAETLACGTGAVAAAVIRSALKEVPSPVSLKVRSGEYLVIHFDHSSGRFKDIILEGSAHILFSGMLLYDSSNNSIRDYYLVRA